jgi:hypothetical protein
VWWPVWVANLWIAGVLVWFFVIRILGSGTAHHLLARLGAAPRRMRLLAAIFANALLLVAAFGVGSLFRPLFQQKLSRLDRLAATTAGGLGLLGTILFLVGLAAFSHVVILSILIAAALLGCWRIYKDAREGGVKLASIRVPLLPAMIIALVLVVTMPVVYRVAYGGFVDVVFSSFLLLALRFALDAEGAGEYVLAGMFGGLVAGTKYTG